MDSAAAAPPAQAAATPRLCLLSGRWSIRLSARFRRALPRMLVLLQAEHMLNVGAGHGAPAARGLLSGAERPPGFAFVTDVACEAGVRQHRLGRLAGVGAGGRRSTSPTWRAPYHRFSTSTKRRWPSVLSHALIVGSEPEEGFKSNNNGLM
jgi:hypothetical protein